jgi:phosphoglycerate kinase
MLSGIAKLSELELENLRVFVRANLDAPLDKSGAVHDPWLVDRLLPTLSLLAEKGARVIVGTRVGDSRDAPSEGANEAAISVEPVAAALAERGKLEVLIPDAATSESVRKVVESLKPGRVCVLENLAREEDTGHGAQAFSRYLFGQVDAYVGDSLRALAFESATGTLLPRFIEVKAPGLGLEAELGAYARLRSQIDSPRLLVWGGNSLTARIDVLESLLRTVDQVAFVGVPANTMLKAIGHDVGTSKTEEDALPLARTLYERLGSRLLLPVDALVGMSPRASHSEVRAVRSIRERDAILDLGPGTFDSLEKEIRNAGAVIWCGAVGLHYNPVFAQGTRRLVSAMAETRAFTVVVGEDSVAAARAVAPELTSLLDCLSEGGQASLALLTGKKLQGLDALRGPIQ